MLLLAAVTMPAQEKDSPTDSLGTHLDYTLSAEAAVGSGDWTAYQLTANRYNSLGTRSNTALGRVAVGVEHRFSDKYILSGKVDVIGSLHGDERAYVQQWYANMKLHHFFVEAGQREIEPVMRDRRLSSGSPLESGNARPLPRVRFGTDGFWTVPYTKQWLEVYFDCGYGKYIDNSYVEDAAMSYINSHDGNGEYTTGKLFHSKKLYLRTNSSKMFYYTLGCDHFAQFGGTKHTYVNGVVTEESKPENLKAFAQVILPLGDSNYTEHGKMEDWVYGNHIGVITMQLSCNIDKQHVVSFYQDNLFEDGSGIKKYNGFDGLWGLEYRSKKPGVQYVRGAVVEYLQTTNQSGYLHWDSQDYKSEYLRQQMPYLETGNDNYYNNGFYDAYANYGMAQGTGLLMSPRYNSDSYKEFTDNSVKAWHLGVEGDIAMTQRYGSFGYLLRGSYREGWGTHTAPLTSKHHSFDAMLQLEWQKGPLRGSVAYAFDNGNVYDNNSTFDVTFSYHGKLF